MLDLYLITPQRPADEIEALCARALAGTAPGPRVGLQLRAAHLAALERRGLARRLRALTQQTGTALLISAEPDLALHVGADGVQLPEAGPDPAAARALLGPNALVIASRHDRAGLQRAHAAGASAATLSPVFEVEGKAPPLGLAGFAGLAASAPLPVIALGGIDVTHVAALRAAGACGVAVIRSVFDAADPGAAVADLCAALAAPQHTKT